MSLGARQKAYSVQLATHTHMVYIELLGGRQAGREGGREEAREGGRDGGREGHLMGGTLRRELANIQKIHKPSHNATLALKLRLWYYK